MEDILHVVSRHDVNPVGKRFYVVDEDGDVLGLKTGDTDGSECQIQAVHLAIEIMELFGIPASVIKWKLKKSGTITRKTVWEKSDPIPQPPPPPGVGHVDFGSW